MIAITSLLHRERSLAVIGLGYVGLPLAVEFSKHMPVIGYDINHRRIDALRQGIDSSDEVDAKELSDATLSFTTNEADLDLADAFIVAVPTPVNPDKTPDLNPVVEATKLVGRHLTKGNVVVYESTVYPGTTEEVCVPILEEISKLKYNVDFFVGYSPERISPSDKVNTLTTITKIVSGSSPETLAFLAALYGAVIKGGIHQVSSIKVAEAAKVVENAQRDVNIAFMNELAKVFHLMDIDTSEVLGAMNTKWNALKFSPGLVGGHCIGVDPYYFIYKAELLGFHSQIILSGRQVNNAMPEFVVNSIVKTMALANQRIKGARVGVFGITYKENCSDIRNSKVINIIEELRTFGMEIVATDAVCDPHIALEAYGLSIQPMETLVDLDVIVLAVGHDAYKSISPAEYKLMCRKIVSPVLVDIKGIKDKQESIDHGFVYWRL